MFQSKIAEWSYYFGCVSAAVAILYRALWFGMHAFSAHHVLFRISSWSSAFCCLWYRSRAMRVRWFTARMAKLLLQAGRRELVPCGFATHHDAHSCDMRHRA